jgi:NAD(P)-dependent dehydrogenase (short-subunit alcohol dehydrogenase family)
MNVLITGASSGIGFETAINLLKQDHVVIAIARSSGKLDGLKQAVSCQAASSRLHTFPFDIADGDYSASLIPFVLERFEKVDILINNAGLLVNKPFPVTRQQEFMDLFRVNVIGHVNMIQAVLPYFNTGAHILNIGSMGGFQGSVKFPGLAAYSSSKAALHALTECLAYELAEQHIKVNCLALGSAQTEMLKAAFPGYKSPVSAEEMGRFIADFALNGHRLFNGKILPVAVTTP